MISVLEVFCIVKQDILLLIPSGGATGVNTEVLPRCPSEMPTVTQTANEAASLYAYVLTDPAGRNPERDADHGVWDTFSCAIRSHVFLVH